MYWLQPPPLLRRAAAVCLVLGAAIWDLTGGSPVPYPVAADVIPPGATITADVVEWIDVPAGAFPASDPIGAISATRIAPGEPLAASVLTGGVEVPPDWWVVPIAVGPIATPGDEALLVVADPPLSAIGLVVEPQVGDPYDLGHRPASVAVPAEAAPIVAAAEQQGLLVTAIRRSTPGQ